MIKTRRKRGDTLMGTKIYEVLNPDFDTVTYRFKTDLGTFDIPLGILERELEHLPEPDDKIQSVNGEGVISLSAKYNARTILYKHLKLGRKEQECSRITFDLIMGDSLLGLIERGNTTNHRNCFDKVKVFLDNTDIAKQNILSLYGVRRTGKTFLMYQAVQYLHDKGVSLDKIAFITISPDKTEALELMQYITMLVEVYEMKYVFIDEITYVKDELSLLTELSDCYFKVKFILTGTNSAGFLPLFQKYLYGRTLRISTSYISYNEYIKLVGECSILEYLRRGGTLQAGTLCTSTHETYLEQCAEIGEDFINTAIIQNLFSTIRQSDYFSDNYSSLSNMYYEDSESLKTLLFKYLGKYSEPLAVQALTETLNICTQEVANTVRFEENLVKPLLCFSTLSEENDFTAEEFMGLLNGIGCLSENLSTGKKFLVPVGLHYGLVCVTLSKLVNGYYELAHRYNISLSWAEFADLLVQTIEHILIDEDFSMIYYD